jgi:hypothetical protein
MRFKRSKGGQIYSVFLLTAGIISLMWLTSCKDEPFEYKIDRVPAFTFRLDTFDIVTTTEVAFFEGPSILHNFGDTAQAIYQRISLEAHGFTPASNEYWFIVDFDTHPGDDNVGLFLSEYDFETGGINDMRLILDYNGEILEFSAVSEMNAVYFQVEAQREEERIMKGSFGGVLYKNGDAESQSVIISSGVFQDINY